MSNTSLKNLNLQINEVDNKTTTDIFKSEAAVYMIFLNAHDYLFIKYYLHLIKNIQLKGGINIGNGVLYYNC